jgi:hypothetical protein
VNDTSKILVEAARDTLAALPTDRTSVEEDAKVATIAVLRQLAILMNTAEVAEISAMSDEDWPDAGDLHLLANDVEASL